MPAAGMTGTDVANIWLARVGAANSLTQQVGNVQSNAALAQGNIWNSAMGGIGTNVNTAIDIGKKIWGPGSTTTPSTFEGGAGVTSGSPGGAVEGAGAGSGEG
jgi:hypothetical protein